MTSAFPSRPARHFLQHIMRLIALALAFALLAAFSFDAEAARLGGGRSAGRQSSQVTQRETARQQPAAPGQQQAAQQPRRQWGGLLGGLAAGLGLAWLANALGLGEGFANVLLIALLVMVGMAVLRMRRGGAAQAAGGPAWPAANSYNPAKVGNDASARPWERAATTAGGSMIGSALGGQAAGPRGASALSKGPEPARDGTGRLLSLPGRFHRTLHARDRVPRRQQSHHPHAGYQTAPGRWRPHRDPCPGSLQWQRRELPYSG